MISNSGPAGKKKSDLIWLFPYFFLVAAVLFLCWIVFKFECQARSKIILLGSFAGLEILAFIYFKVETKKALDKKDEQTSSLIEEIKNSQRGLLNDEKIAVIMKFASVMAHELKNPLSSLKNISYYLIKTIKNEDAKSKHMMEMLSSEVDRTDRMIINFSDIARAKRISKTPADVSNLSESVLSKLKFAPAIELKKEIEPGIEANIDPDRLSLVLINLIKNALDAVGENGRIRVGLKKVGTFFELSVRNSGPGIDKETFEHMFDPMFTTKNKCLGLGLTVVKETITAHGGKVEVETENGKGSTFRVFVPL